MTALMSAASGVTGYVFDRWRIFEDFVTTALSEALWVSGGRCVPEAALHLDEADRVDLRPDLLWCRNGVAVAVVDAKYKPNGPKASQTPTCIKCWPTAPCLDYLRGIWCTRKGTSRSVPIRFAEPEW